MLKSRLARKTGFNKTGLLRGRGQPSDAGRGGGWGRSSGSLP